MKDFQFGSQHGDTDRHQNLFTVLTPHPTPGPLHSISLQSAHNLVSNVANSTDRRTDRKK